MIGSAALARLERIAHAVAAEELSDEIRTLRERTAGGRFYVACLGQFKRGKSTLINALIAEPVLPTGVAPITSIPTIVRYGDDSVRVLH
jgi:ribosome biogenesis GTPase A